MSGRFTPGRCLVGREDRACCAPTNGPKEKGLRGSACPAVLGGCLSSPCPSPGISHNLLSHSTSRSILVPLFSNYYVPKTRNLGARFCASFGLRLLTGCLREDLQHADLPASVCGVGAAAGLAPSPRQDFLRPLAVLAGDWQRAYSGAQRPGFLARLYLIPAG